ncbi:MAG: hypothetical protein KF901_01580 [Myxococcales bacterium]|nr:hypothetical protein [Myxococcales bacterium]
MKRRELLATLERLAFAAELAGDRRQRPLQSVAWAMRHLDEDPRELVESGKLAAARGVGPKMVALVADLLDGIEPAIVRELEGDLPRGLFELRRLKGLGAKKIHQLWTELGVTNLAELEHACSENRLVTLQGFGAKTQASLLTQLAALAATAHHRRRDQVAALVGPVLAALEAHPDVQAALVLGDYRRGRSLVELPIQIAVARRPADAASDAPPLAPRKPLDATSDSALDATSDAALADTSEAAASPLHAARPLADMSEGAPLDVEVPQGVELVDVAPDRLGAFAIARTAAPEHVAALEARARTLGLELDTLRAPDEESVYVALGLHPTPSERREAHVPLVQAGRAVTPLVRLEDLRGSLHNHTNASDGAASLEAMRAAATALGHEYLAITEHSVSAFYARGLDALRLETQRAAIETLARAPGCALLAGVESDILEDGALDYPPEVLAPLDLVVASVHRRFAHDRDAATRRLVAAARNPHTRVLGHPTGRLLLGRPPVDFDVDAVLEACATAHCAVELNASPHRLDLDAEHLAKAKARGVLVSIAADAHATAELENLRYGVAIARRAGLTAEDVLNTRPLPDLRAWLTRSGSGASSHHEPDSADDTRQRPLRSPR